MSGDETIRDFQTIGRLPAPGDNVAIATRRLEAGTRFDLGGEQYAIDHAILEGHRFAVRPIAPGEPLLSWGLPFGYATRPIACGDYVCNPKILQALALREVPFALPAEANFRDNPLEPYQIDPATFCAGTQVTPYGPHEARSFRGFRRPHGRGVGTRNHIVVLAVTSRVGSWARALEERCRSLATTPTFDGVVAVAHTEGGGASAPNNLELLLRTYAGFVIHPNVGAILIVDDGLGAVTGRALRRYLQDQHYPLDDLLHRFITLRGSFDADLDLGASLLRTWVPAVEAMPRTEELVAELKVGLQCGGSDAFSGVSGNPLAAWIAREVIRHGGAANLAETDELIGAEEYVLQNVRDLETAQRFLATVQRFKDLVGWHGHTAEGNPSGGNNYRGLYNIALKSIGAAAKKNPDVRLDYVIDYSQLMREPGYYFMDSPGNDLESIAGQVASGSNLLYFVTGNGSITNFPFVPTIKVVTTTARFNLLSHDMDVNAGEYLNGTPMDELGRKTFDLTLRVASGERSVGERAGHAQVSIWRNWQQTGPGGPERVGQLPAPLGRALRVKAPDPGDPLAGLTFNAIQTGQGPVTDQIGLVLPTSLCAGQIGKRIADRLNARNSGGECLSRFVALPHTEGCGVSSGSSEELYTRTMLGYILHPLVGQVLLLEHGCEKTHNDYIRHELRAVGADLDHFGWASIQLDGGIDAVVAKSMDWFATVTSASDPLRYETAGWEALRLGLAVHGEVTPDLAAALSRLVRAIAGAGGTVVLPENTPLLRSDEFIAATLREDRPAATIAYGDRALTPGLQVMATQTDHWIETLTGLGATGVEIVLTHIDERPVQAHRMIPTLQVTTNPALDERYRDDLDLVVASAISPECWADQFAAIVLRVAERDYAPKLNVRGNIDFQFTRGLLGVSM